jgi:2-polyprenyl-3-methyl-5-hydroxy-6-metoxy-1,4-benzoquinol methylase
MNQQEVIAAELDKEGHDTLDAIAGADKFNRWMFETVQPFLKGNVLEIGSGIGNISAFLLETKMPITLSDYNESYCDILRNKFAGYSNLAGVLSIDLVDEKFDEKFAALMGSFDAIIALNVVEHIKDHDLAVANCKKLLKKGGHLIILVPAYQKLYNRFDTELGHYRRYTKKKLNAVMGKHLSMLHNQYFNFAGIAGWFVSGAVLKKKIIPASQMKFYNTLVPVFRLTDKLVFNKVGLSVIGVGVKQ